MYVHIAHSPMMGNPMRDLRALLKHANRRERLLNVVGLIACIGAGAVQPLMNIPFGQVTSDLVDFTAAKAGEVANGQPQAPAVNHRIVMFLYLAVGSFLSTYLYTSIYVWTGETITNRIRRKTVQSLLSQELAYYQDGNAVALTTELQMDLDAIQSGISEKVPNTVMYLSCAFTGFIVAIAKAWNLGLALLTMLPCLLLTGYLMTKYGFAYIGKVMTALSPASSLSQEALGGISTIRSLGAESSITWNVSKLQHAAVRLARTKSLIWGGCMAAMTFIIYSGYALCFAFGGRLLRQKDLSAGTLITVFLCVMMGSFAFAQIPSQLHSFIAALTAASKLEDIIQRQPAIASLPETEAIKVTSLNDGITLSNVSFSYPARPDVQVLRGVNITIKSGETVAIVGHSGSGKSTLASLLLALNRPEPGEILYDGVDVRYMDLATLRGQLVASVLQEPQLFDFSIFDNVALGLRPIDRLLPKAEQERLIRDACRTAQAHDFVSAFPDGYQTMCGEAGVKLSGGQKARIAIARALVRRAPVLLLDEATANLDTVSERALHAALETTSVGRTAIVIAHRLSTVRKADRIIVMHAGQVLAEGTHDSLMADRHGPYRRLFDTEDAVVDQTGQASSASTICGRSSSDQGTVIEGHSKQYAVNSVGHTGTAADAEETEKGEPMATPDENGVNPKKVGDPGTWASIWMMCSLGKGDLAIISMGIFGSIIAGALYPIFAIVYAKAYSAFGTHQNDSKLQNFNALLFFICAIGGGVGVLMQWFCLGYASDRIACVLRAAMLRRVLRAPMTFFDEQRNSSGQLTNIINNSPTRVSNFVGTGFGTYVASVVTLVGGCIVGLAYSWKLGLVNMAVLPLTLGTGIIRLKVVDSREAKCKVAHEPSNALAVSAVSLLETVSSLAAEDVIYRRYNERLESASAKTAWMAGASSILFALAQTNMYFVMALGFWYGSQLVFKGEITSLAFFATFTAIVSGSFQAVNVLTQAPELSQARGATLDIGRILTLQTQSTGGNLKALPLGDVRLDDVTFNYPSRPEPSLSGLSLLARHHGFSALCGPSGSGKSTVIRLLERFYQPASGLVTIGGRPVEEVHEPVYREAVALVSQEPVLFNMSILDNILLGAPKWVTELPLHSQESEVWSVLAPVNMSEFIRDLPDGLNTNLGAKGVALSGGQRQRIVLARALLRRPALLLLDEATSSLDHANQAAVQQALDELARDLDHPLTIISVAHRLSTIANADSIYVMRDGRVEEVGRYNDLVRRGGLFTSLAIGDSENKAEPKEGMEWL